jgi:hypothetical protein
MGAPNTKNKAPKEAAPDHTQNKLVKAINKPAPYMANMTNNSMMGGFGISSLSILLTKRRYVPTPNSGTIK